MNKDIIYSFQEAIEVVDKGRDRCLSHDDYWLNIIFPGRVSLLISEWISMDDIDNLKDYDNSLWQRVHKELDLLMDPSGICTHPTRLFYFTLSFAFFFWIILGIFVGRSFLWPFGFINYGVKLISTLPFGVSLIFLGFLAFIFVFLLWSIKSRVKRCDKKLTKKSDELEKLVQDLIGSAIKFFKEENIDPEEYPLRLKFKNYKGLKYLKEKNSDGYIAYLDIR